MSIGLVAIAALPSPARSEGPGAPHGRALADSERVAAAARVMASLRGASRDAAARIRAAYTPHVRAWSLRDRAALRTALQAKRLVAWRASAPFNVVPRTHGAHPLGEFDLPHQALYLAARPETLGCLLHVASRVHSGPLDVTSLVRHREYQRRLALGNPNGRTRFPTHVMGLAFDLSIRHASPTTAAEIRDVLERLAAAGDLFFVAEQRQLVFHVVPAPQRRRFYAALYEGLTSAPSWLPPQIEWPAVRGTVSPPVVQAPSIATVVQTRLYDSVWRWLADTEWIWVTPGALLATVLWLVTSVGFRFYVRNFSDYSAVYGAIGGVIVLLLWLYLSGFALLVGAELNAEIDKALPSRDDRPQSLFRQKKIGPA